MGALATNTAWGELALPLSQTEGYLLLANTQGDRFPSPVEGKKWFFATISGETGNMEIVRCDKREDDKLFITRGQDGTFPTSFVAGSKVELRVCAALLNDKVSFTDLDDRAKVIKSEYEYADLVVKTLLQDQIDEIEQDYATLVYVNSEISDAKKYTDDEVLGLKEKVEEDFLSKEEAFNGLVVPTGTILPFLGPTVPKGYLLCNGQFVDKETYADLYAMFKDRFGEPPEPSVFALPNLSGKFLECTTTTTDLGAFVKAGLPNITGSITMEVASPETYDWWEQRPYPKSPLKHTEQAFSVDGAMEISRKETKATYIGESSTTGQALEVSLDASRIDAAYGNSTTVQPASVKVFYIVKV